jgi:hypothetical protein
VSVRIFPAFRNILTLPNDGIQYSFPPPTFHFYSSPASRPSHIHLTTLIVDRPIAIRVCCTELCARRFGPESSSLALSVMQPTISRLMMFDIRWCWLVSSYDPSTAINNSPRIPAHQQQLRDLGDRILPLVQIVRGIRRVPQRSIAKPQTYHEAGIQSLAVRSNPGWKVCSPPSCDN